MTYGMWKAILAKAIFILISWKQDPWKLFGKRPPCASARQTLKTWLSDRNLPFVFHRRSAYVFRYHLAGIFDTLQIPWKCPRQTTSRLPQPLHQLIWSSNPPHQQEISPWHCSRNISSLQCPRSLRLWGNSKSFGKNAAHREIQITKLLRTRLYYVSVWKSLSQETN